MTLQMFASKQNFNKNEWNSISYRAENDTDKANFRCTVDKKEFHEELEKGILGEKCLTE